MNVADEPAFAEGAPAGEDRRALVGRRFREHKGPGPPDRAVPGRIRTLRPEILLPVGRADRLPVEHERTCVLILVLPRECREAGVRHYAAQQLIEPRRVVFGDRRARRRRMRRQPLETRGSRPWRRAASDRCPEAPDWRGPRPGRARGRPEPTAGGGGKRAPTVGKRLLRDTP